MGATGVAGHQALLALVNHPWFELTAVAGGRESVGRLLRERLADQGAAGGALLQRLPVALADLRLIAADALPLDELDLVFSMLPTGAARDLEARCAQVLPVLSTAAAYRMEPDTPLMIPGVNVDHAELLATQSKARGWKGFVAPGPNCTTIGLAVTLAPLQAAFGVTSATLTSMQALSGAGRAATELVDAITDNILVHIPGEEQKVEQEAGKILGAPRKGAIVPADFPVSATCTRVAVSHGHTLCVSVGLGNPATPDAVIAAWRAADPFSGRPLPSAPQHWIEVRDEPDRPQPRLDRDAGGGMTTVVGRVRPDAVSGGIKYVVLSHNAVLGAAGGAVLLAEDLVDRGVIGS